MTGITNQHFQEDLNFMSQHPVSQKIGTIMGMVDRTFLLSHPKFHSKNISFVINTLIDNDYPLNFIFDNNNKKLRLLLNNRTLRQNDNNSIVEETKKKTWFTILYISSISEKFTNIIKDLNVKLPYCSLNKIKFVKTQKNILSVLSTKNVVYLIKCKDCDATYVSQIKRQLKIRIRIKKNTK